MYKIILFAALAYLGSPHAEAALHDDAGVMGDDDVVKYAVMRVDDDVVKDAVTRVDDDVVKYAVMRVDDDVVKDRAVTNG